VTTFPAPEGMSVYFRNVTEQRKLRRNAPALLAESERQKRIYETALNSTPDFVYVFDLDHRALYANDALLKTWGVADVRGKKWMDLGYEQWHADLHDRELDEVIQTRAPIRGEIPFSGTNGTRMYDYIFAPVFDARAKWSPWPAPPATSPTAGRRTVACRNRPRLAASDRAKDDFLATLSHELRNPLAPLRNSIALLRRDGLQGEALAKIHGSWSARSTTWCAWSTTCWRSRASAAACCRCASERVEIAAVVRTAVETSNPLMQSAGHQLVLEFRQKRCGSKATRCGWRRCSPTCSTTPPATPTPAARHCDGAPRRPAAAHQRQRHRHRHGARRHPAHV
jgi:PAS domain-containing protein